MAGRKNTLFMILILAQNFYYSQQGSWTCGLKIINSGITLGKLISDFMQQSWRFEKQLIARSFFDIQRTFKECKGYVPTSLQGDDCFNQMQIIAREIQKIYEKFDVELYEEGITELLYNCPTVIKLYDYCLNSQIFKNQVEKIIN